MSGLFPKPADRSKIGIKGHIFQAGWLLSRVAASAGSLNVGLDDFAIMIDYIFPPRLLNGPYIIYKSLAGAGYVIRCATTNILWFQLDSGAVMVVIPITFGERCRLWFFADRDGNLYTYCNGALINTTNIVAGNLNQDNGGNYQLNYDNGTPTYRSGDILGIYHFNFGVGGLPDVATRAMIIGQDMDNPYVVPLSLSSRPNYATEERLRITFDNHDPAATVITDESPQANHLTIAGGLTCASILKEMMSP